MCPINKLRRRAGLARRSGKAKIADVGLAHTVETTRIKDLEAVGTALYPDPYPKAQPPACAIDKGYHCMTSPLW